MSVDPPLVSHNDGDSGEDEPNYGRSGYAPASLAVPAMSQHFGPTAQPPVSSLFASLPTEAFEIAAIYHVGDHDDFVTFILICRGTREIRRRRLEPTVFMRLTFDALRQHALDERVSDLPALVSSESSGPDVDEESDDDSDEEGTAVALTQHIPPLTEAQMELIICIFLQPMNFRI